MQEQKETTFWQRLKQKADVYTEPGAEVISEIFIEGAIGAIIPGATSVMFNYKQHRMERNLLRLIQELGHQLEQMKVNYDKLSENNRKLIKEHFAGLLCDYVIDEQQEEKIKYIANGFITLSGQKKLDFDETILYLDLLKNLRMIDISILADKDYRSDKRIICIC